ncbi:PAP2 superfamily protein [Blastococcus fimeti]|nr:PAP2 superfamily protein [Blastococcus fimeti]
MTATLAPGGARAETTTALHAAVDRGPAGPGLLRAFARPRWWAEFAVIGVLYAVYSLVRNSVGDVVVRAYANGRDILALEDGWGLALERGLNDWVHRTEVVSAAVALHYATLHFLVTPAVLVWLFLRRPTRYRMVSAILMITTALALIGFYWLPTAPPRLLSDEGFVDVMSQTATWGWWPASGTPGSDAISNQFAAMPSLHCAWAAWCGLVLVLLARRTWVRIAGAVYPFSTFFVVLGSGNHYLLDVVAGVLVLCVGAGVVLAAASTARERGQEAVEAPADDVPLPLAA